MYLIECYSINVNKTFTEREGDILSEKIKKYREQLGMTQQEMADELGLSRQNYHQKENELRKWADDDKVKIRELLRKKLDPAITIDELFYS